MSFENSFGFLLPDMAAINDEVTLAMPDGCGECPAQCLLGSQLGDLLMRKHIMTSAAEYLVGDEGAQFDEMIDAQVPPEQADNVKRVLRQQAAEDMDEIDAKISETKTTMDTTSQSCNKVLKMRASKEGMTYTVSVCTSPETYEHAAGDHAPAHIYTKKTD